MDLATWEALPDAAPLDSTRNRAWREQNPEKDRARKRRWRQNHPERVRELKRLSRARLKAARGR